MSETVNNVNRKRLQGKVVSNAMNQTVVVEVNQIKTHPKYHKRYSSNKRYQAHDPENQYQIGDLVEIQETAPTSKNKKWRVINKIK